MIRKPVSYHLSFLLMMLIVLLSIPAYSQEKMKTSGNKSFFVECGGSGVALLTGNIDFRFSKGRNDGLGMRIGIGGESTKTDPVLFSGEIKTKLFTVPVEINYLFGQKRVSFEIGYSLTYISETESSNIQIFDPSGYSSNESDKFFVSYLPIGFRLKPKTNGFMLKFNVGPLINYSAPNIFHEDKSQFWAGLAKGYSFH